VHCMSEILPSTSYMVASIMLCDMLLQALSLDSRSIEALLLKGSALVELKKTPEAVSHFREALRLAPYRYEAYNSTFSSQMCSLLVGPIAGF